MSKSQLGNVTHFSWVIQFNNITDHTVNRQRTTFQNEVYTDQTSIEMKRDVLWADFTWLLRHIDTERCSGSVLEIDHKKSCSVTSSYKGHESYSKTSL